MGSFQKKKCCQSYRDTTRRYVWKNRFGQGYQIEMKVKHPVDADEDALDGYTGMLQASKLMVPGQGI